MARAIKEERGSSERLEKAEAEAERARRELQELMIEVGLDAAGILDPTPTSDLLSAAYALSRGDTAGAALSLVSCVPYIGDALAKPLKESKLAAKILKASRRLDSLTATLNRLKCLRRKAVDDVIAARAAARRAKLGEAVENCPLKNPFGTRVPATGSWRPGRGHGLWTPGEDSRNADKILKITKGRPVKFVNGYPDFSPYAAGKVRIAMRGEDAVDFAAANRAAAKTDLAKRFPELRANPPATPKGHTWHHKEDGETMELIPSDLHNNVPHTGGASIVKDKEY